MAQELVSSERIRHGLLFAHLALEKALKAMSDIDLLVASPLFDLPVRQDDVSKRWRLTARTNSRIEPIPPGGVAVDGGCGQRDHRDRPARGHADRTGSRRMNRS